MSRSVSLSAAIARGLFALPLFSGGALADDTATSAPHWSGLPIWGAEAEARGYQIPRPFGIGITAYSARQPVNIHDLQLGFNGKDPVSVKNFLQINTVDTAPFKKATEVVWDQWETKPFGDFVKQLRAIRK